MAGIFAPAAGAPALAGAGGRDIHPAPRAPAGGAERRRAQRADDDGAPRPGGRSSPHRVWWEELPPLALGGGVLRPSPRREEPLRAHAPEQQPRPAASERAQLATHPPIRPCGARNIRIAHSTRHTPAHPPVRGEKHSRVRAEHKRSREDREPPIRGSAAFSSLKRHRPKQKPRTSGQNLPAIARLVTKKLFSD